MDQCVRHIPTLLLTLAFLTVTQGQYYDILQGIQQLFQPFQQQNDFISQLNNINSQQQNRQEHKKKQKVETPSQYDYVFATTTPKPSRKTTKPNSSQNKPSNNRHFNSELIFNDYSNFEVTTKRNRVTPNNRKTTTVKPRQTTTYSNKLNNKRPVTENVFENNNQNVYSVNNYQKHENTRPDNTAVVYPSNNRNPNVEHIDLNTQNTVTNNGFNSDYIKPANNRNPDVFAAKNQNSQTQNNRNTNFGSTTSSFINSNRGNSFNNRVTPNNFGNNFNNNRGSLNTDYDGNGSGFYPNNPLINRPGVKPAPIDPNQPAITNKPVTNNFERPSDGFTERPVESPEILIGPDEEDMSEGQKRRYIDMAERMCDRYKSLNVKEVVAVPLLPSPDPVELNVSSCVPINVPLVIGGKVVTINEFPHMALVGWRKIRADGYSWKCGGSLISNEYILTAGHCTYQDKDYDVDSGPPQAVQLGSSYLDDPRATVVKISAVIRHPKYKQRRSYYDIALIKMVHTVTFSEVIRPACLGVPPPVEENVIATGWGRTEFGGDHSLELRSVSLPVWNMAECREIWGTSLKLPNGPTPESHMCAGEKQGGKDTCQGDSGGPAQIQDGCVWRVVAVTSFGRSCGAPNTPALYAVTKRAFIAAQVFGDQVEQGNTVNRNQDTQRYDGNRNQGTQGSRGQGTQRYDGNSNHGTQRYDGNSNQGTQGSRGHGTQRYDGNSNQNTHRYDGNTNQATQRYDGYSNQNTERYDNPYGSPDTQPYNGNWNQGSPYYRQEDTQRYNSQDFGSRQPNYVNSFRRQ